MDTTHPLLSPREVSDDRSLSQQGPRKGSRASLVYLRDIVFLPSHTKWISRVFKVGLSTPVMDSVTTILYPYETRIQHCWSKRGVSRRHSRTVLYRVVRITDLLWVIYPDCKHSKLEAREMVLHWSHDPGHQLCLVQEDLSALNAIHPGEPMWQRSGVLNKIHEAARHHPKDVTKVPRDRSYEEEMGERAEAYVCQPCWAEQYRFDRGEPSSPLGAHTAILRNERQIRSTHTKGDLSV